MKKNGYINYTTLEARTRTYIIDLEEIATFISLYLGIIFFISSCIERVI